jgi:DNA invertase Pin-like site-specific DNA recombinase
MKNKLDTTTTQFPKLTMMLVAESKRYEREAHSMRTKRGIAAAKARKAQRSTPK